MPSKPLRSVRVGVAVGAMSVFVVVLVMFLLPPEIKALWLPENWQRFFSLSGNTSQLAQGGPTQRRGQVLQAQDEVPTQQSLVVALPAIFQESLTALSSTIEQLLTTRDLLVLGTANIGGDVTISGETSVDNLDVNGILTLNDQDLDLGAGDLTAATGTITSLNATTITAGTITASNLISSLTAGDGISVGTGQSPTITNTDRGSAQNIFKNIKSGSDTISAGGNNDTLEFVTSGSGLTISADTTNKKLTFALSGSGTGWVTSGTDVILDDITSNVGIGIDTPTSTLHVVGDAILTGGLNNSLGGITNAGAITGATGLTSSGTITFSGLGAGVVKSSLGGVLSSSAINLASSEVSGTLGVANGGTGISSYTIGDLLYASGATTLSSLGIGGDGEVLTVSGGALSWASVSGGGLCPSCLVDNPNSTQTISPTGASTTGLSVRQASGGTADIFNVTDSTGTTKYLRVDDAGNVMLGSGTLATTGNLSIAPANTDPITITPIAEGAASYTGTVTSEDLTAARTWTLPDATGTFCLTTGNCNGVGGNFGGSGSTNYLAKFNSATTVGDSLIYDNGTNVGIGTTTLTQKLTVAGGGAFSGALSTATTLAATGATTLGNTLQVTGATSLLSTLDVTGASTLSSTLGVTGAATFGSTASITSNLTVDTNSLYVDASTNRVGIGTTSPGQALDVVGSFLLRDAASPTKALRVRTSGILTDWEAGGASLSLSVWSGADFTGTQYDQILFSSSGNLMQFQRGFFPATDSSFNIGASDKYWANAYLDKVFLDDGSAGSPAVTFGNDQNSGFYRQSSDLISFVANGQNALNVDGTSGAGRLMIGNGNAVSRLQINDDTNAAASGITFGGSALTYLQLYKSASNVLSLTGGALNLTGSTALTFGGTTSLGETTGAADSGAFVVGAFDEFGLSNSTNVQDVLDDLDAAIAALGTNYWSQATGVVYPTSATDDFAVGGSTILASMFGIDESAGNFYFGYDNSANPTFNFEATDGDAGEFGFNTNDSFFVSNANFGVGDTSPTALFTVGSGDLFQVNSSGLALGPNASHLNPTFSFTGDPDTGMYLSAANEISFTTAGSQKVSISSAGNLGINTGNWMGLNSNESLYFETGTALLRSSSIVYVNLDANANETNAAFILRSNASGTSGSTELYRFQEDGRAGFGDASPDNILELLSSAASNTQLSIGNTSASDFDTQIGFELADGTNTFTLGVDDSDADKFKISTTALGTNDRLVIDSTGNIGLANSAPGALVHAGSSAVSDGTTILRLEDANSTCNFTADAGSPTCGSDATLKKNVATLSTSELLTKVTNLRPVSYQWNTDGTTAPTQYGFIAQEVAAQFPDLVKDGTWIDGSTRKFLNMGGLMPYLVGAVKEQQTQLSSVQLRLDQQGQFLPGSVAGATTDSQLEELLTRVSALENEQSSVSAILAQVELVSGNIWTILSDFTVKGQAIFERSVAFMGDVRVGGRLISGDRDRAGFIAFTPGQTQAEVIFARPYNQKPIVTLGVEGENVAVTLREVGTTGFKVVLSGPVSQPITVHWQAVEVNDAPTTSAQGSESITAPTPTPAPSIPPDVAASPTPESSPLPSPSPVISVSPSPIPSPTPELSPTPTPLP